MPRPTAHLLALIELLQAGGVRTAAELAERLSVDERTVRRYIEHLLDLNMPVESIRGRYGGFRMRPGAHLPPLMLTEEEAFSVVIGLGLIGRSGPSAATRIAADTATAKLTRVLPQRVAARLAGLRDVQSTSGKTVATALDVDAVLVATLAANEGRPLLIAHRRNGTRSERTVLPYGVVEHRGRWYLVGLDSVSDSVRTFRLDRIEQIEIGSGRFTRPADLDPVAELTSSLAAAPRRHAVAIEVHAPETAVRRLLPASVAETAAAPQDGWLLVTLEAEQLGWLAGILAQLDSPFRIIRPAALRDEVRLLAQRILDRAGAPSSH